jgi:hypothetical protein
MKTGKSPMAYLIVPTYKILVVPEEEARALLPLHQRAFEQKCEGAALLGLPGPQVLPE